MCVYVYTYEETEFLFFQSYCILSPWMMTNFIKEDFYQQEVDRDSRLLKKIIKVRERECEKEGEEDEGVCVRESVSMCVVWW